MHPFPILAFSVPPTGSAFDDMLRLIGVATLVWAFFKGVRSLVVKKPAASSPAPVAAPAQPLLAAAPVEQGIPPEVIVAIAAAVHFITGRSQRVISIRDADPVWEKSGRQSILTSHRIR